MLRNPVEAAEESSAALRRVILFKGAKYYGVHLGAFPTPVREDDLRHLPPSFYYDQQDWLRARAGSRPWDAMMRRPDVACGLALGNPMNLTMVIALYAAICRELGLPLRSPGAADRYGRLPQTTDAGLLARDREWVAVSAPGGAAYNIANGDLFRWNRPWPAIARDSGIEPEPPQTVRLAEALADRGPVWRRVAARHGLVDTPYECIAARGFGAFVFRCDDDVVSDTTRRRQAGFSEVVDSQGDVRAVPAATGDPLTAAGSRRLPPGHRLDIQARGGVLRSSPAAPHRHPRRSQPVGTCSGPGFRGTGVRQGGSASPRARPGATPGIPGTAGRAPAPQQGAGADGSFTVGAKARL